MAASMTGPERVQKAIETAGLDVRIVEMPASTHTVQEAAATVGVEPGRIAKSLIFRGTDTDAPVLAILSGDNRLNTKKLEGLIGEPVGKADAQFVRDRTGYVIGGVPPLGHPDGIRVYFDEDLFHFDTVWAAAGHAYHVFEAEPAALMAAAGAVKADLKA